MIAHHPPLELLFDYAAGVSAESASLLAASHLVFCRECRDRVARIEALGGAMIDRLPGEAPATGAFEAVLGRLDEPEEILPQPEFDAVTRTILPSPLRDYLNADLKDLKWRRRSLVHEEVPLGRTEDGAKLTLLKIHAGKGVLNHTHKGEEFTLVLQGGYSDADGHYGRGDVAVGDPSVTHRPVADPGEDCI